MTLICLIKKCLNQTEKRGKPFSHRNATRDFPANGLNKILNSVKLKNVSEFQV